MSSERFSLFCQSISSIQPPAYGPGAQFGVPGKPVATLLDSFSNECFSPEAETIPFTPVDFAETLDYYTPQMVMIESAWQGNSGTWTHQLVGQKGPKQSFYDLVRAARSREIPIVFWNKEDPPHYEDFLPIAKEADLVLTTAGELTDQYKSAIGHDRVGVLPFAAQPLIHHPFGRQDTDSDICFAGQYFAHKYPERRQQMEYLFPAAARHRFTIYSRELGNDSRYAFPPPFSSLVRGSVPYQQMLAEYRRHKIFINVNSVIDSETMCARRIFEISAAGGCIVSAPSRAISAFYNPDEIFTPADEEEARAIFSKLIDNDDYRAQSALKSWRRTLKYHTYRHRMDQIKSLLGIQDTERRGRPNILINGTDAPITQLMHLIKTVSEDVQEVQRVYVLADSILDSSELNDLAQVIDMRRVFSLLHDDLIVISGWAKIGHYALTDMALAVQNYRHRGPIAKIAYGERPSPTYGAGIEMSPLLWGAPADSLERNAFESLLQGRTGVFDTLDRFNLIDTRDYPISLPSGWEA